MRTAKTLIRLGACPGRSESSLGAQGFVMRRLKCLDYCSSIRNQFKVLINIRDFNGHLPYPFQNPISNFYLSLEAGKSSTDSVILRKLTNVEIIFRAWTKSLKKTKLYFDD